MKKITTLMTLVLLCSCAQQTGTRWSAEKANSWYENIAWPVGCDYVPAYAGNQIQMWSSATWDPEAIDSELALAEDLGFNTVRIFLHHKVWEAEREAYFAHIDEFLGIASSHGISTLMTLFTNGGSEKRYYGEEISPVPGIHNSIWARTPGETIINDPSRWGIVEKYEKDVLKRYKDDSRIICWCLYNEPANGTDCKTLPLLRKVFDWAREINPSQPLTATIVTNPFHCNPKHYGRLPLIAYVCENSDIMSFHCYDDTQSMADFIALMESFGRPVFCTEYLGRTRGSTFEAVLPVMKEHKVAAYNFGLVNGATQCHYQWNDVVDGEKVPFTEEPELWFHDIFLPDHTPWSQSEVSFLKDLIKK